MKRIFLFFLLFPVLSGCGLRPENFTCYYRNENTGLAGLIDTDGYYISQHACDTAFYSMYMFYSNGLFTIATFSRMQTGLSDCFENGGNSRICRYPVWGTYQIEGNRIKTQVIRLEGNGFVVFRDYEILPDRSIVNVSDYVQPEYINLGYMTNYPSFSVNPCRKSAVFQSLKTKRDSTECPLLKKKWFWGK